MQTFTIEFNQIPSQNITVKAADIGQALSKALEVYRMTNPPKVIKVYERI